MNIANAQKNVVQKNENWTQIYMNARISNKWGINCDLSYRFKNLFDGTTQTVFRVGPTYYFTDNIFLYADIARFTTYPSSNNTNESIPEYRGFQRLYVNSTRGKIQISQRYRFEQRYIRKNIGDSLLNTYRFNYRFGYQFNAQFPLKGKKIEAKSWFINIYDEVFINFGKQIIYNYFDQNRVFVGLGYQISKSANAIIGYQYIWQQTSGGNSFNSIHCVRATLLKNIDLRKEE